MVVKKKQVKVRFAPSPTGNLHVGGLRTALFNWLFAKHYQGVFLLRVEDTDRERSTESFMHAQLAALKWVGITSDEVPLIQSERIVMYQTVAQKLLEQKKAYRCVCTSEQVRARLAARGITDEHYGYDGFCRTREISQDQPAAIRFMVPDTLEVVTFEDAIRGTVTVHKDQLDDFVIIRSGDSMPMYNFCVVIDDFASGITHIIRGEDHISNTPKQILLYQALGYELPIFAHIPMILGSDGNRLSKRDGAVDVLSYRDSGYLPDALLNYIARLGWSHGDQELFTVQELISYFTLDHVGKKPAIFDYAKLEWINSVYMRNYSADNLLVLLQNLDTSWDKKVSRWSHEQLVRLISLYKERTTTLVQLADSIHALACMPAGYSQDDTQAWITSEILVLLSLVLELFETLDQIHWTHDGLQTVLKNFCKEHDIKLVAIAQPLRIALTGAAQSPGIFDLLELVGKQESILRIAKLLAL